jgi:hypothetical protein
LTNMHSDVRWRAAPDATTRVHGTRARWTASEVFKGIRVAYKLELVCQESNHVNYYVAFTIIISKGSQLASCSVLVRVYH